MTKRLHAKVTAKGELSLPAELFKPHAPPGYFWLGVPSRPWKEKDGLRITLTTYHDYSPTSRACRKTYRPAERSSAIRVSVKTEFKTVGEDPKKFVGIEFRINKANTRHGVAGDLLKEPIEYIQIDIRRKENGRPNRND